MILWALFVAALATGDEPPPDTCALSIELIDAASGKPLPGLIQLRDAAGGLVRLEGLLSRGFGLEPDQPPGPAIHEWSVLPARTTVQVPQARLTLRAFAGLETDLAELSLDLAGRSTAAVQVPLARFYHAADRGYRSANTHLHLKRLSRHEADRYLVEVSLADGLDVVFLSYLERAVDDLEYTSNKYTRADLADLSGQGVDFGNGEEHRHNLTSYDEGYGHVMLLNIPELIQPVSIGPGITRQGSDGPALKPGMERARELGGKVIWCHNSWGLEDIPSWIMGRLHANNIFDGGTHGSYRHSFYRYLNAGLRVPFSTGTDWFMYDFSRVYVPAAGPLSPEQWLDVLAEGRSWITNGPLLEFRVAGRSLGDTVDLAGPGEVSVDARAVGRIDFGRIELVRCGQVIGQAPSRPDAGHFAAELQFNLAVTEPCWLALRTPPPPVKDDPELQAPVPKNELAGDLFAHTSAVYVTVAGRGYFDPAAARSLLAEMEANRHLIAEHAHFADDAERAGVLGVYDEGAVRLREQLEQAGSR